MQSACVPKKRWQLVRGEFQERARVAGMRLLDSVGISHSRLPSATVCSHWGSSLPRKCVWGHKPFSENGERVTKRL